MNTPARFESLLWMASPMMAWAQASVEAPTTGTRVTKPVPAQSVVSNPAKRKRRKAVT